MGALKYFPADQTARAQIGLIIAELCRDDREAEAFLREILECYNEYPGPASLREIYRTKIRRPEGDEWKGYGPKPPVLCGLCNDTGAREDGGAWVACDCPAGDAEYAGSLNRLSAALKGRIGFSRELQVALTGKDAAAGRDE